MEFFLLGELFCDLSLVALVPARAFKPAHLHSYCWVWSSLLRPRCPFAITPPARGRNSASGSHCHGCIFVVDASNGARLQEARDALATIYSHPRMRGKPLLLLANKSDKLSVTSSVMEAMTRINTTFSLNSMPGVTEHTVFRYTAIMAENQRVPHPSLSDGIVWLVNAIKNDFFPSLALRVATDIGEFDREQEVNAAERSARAKANREERERLEEQRDSAQAKAPPSFPA